MGGKVKDESSCERLSNALLVRTLPVSQTSPHPHSTFHFEDKHSPAWGSGFSSQICRGTNSVSVCHPWVASLLLPFLLHPTLRPFLDNPRQQSSSAETHVERPRTRSQHLAGTLKLPTPLPLLSSTPNQESSSSLHPVPPSPSSLPTFPSASFPFP